MKLTLASWDNLLTQDIIYKEWKSLLVWHQGAVSWVSYASLSAMGLDSFHCEVRRMHIEVWGADVSTLHMQTLCIGHVQMITRFHWCKKIITCVCVRTQISQIWRHFSCTRINDRIKMAHRNGFVCDFISPSLITVGSGGSIPDILNIVFVSRISSLSDCLWYWQLPQD